MLVKHTTFSWIFQWTRLFAFLNTSGYCKLFSLRVLCNPKAAMTPIPLDSQTPTNQDRLDILARGCLFGTRNDDLDQNQSPPCQTSIRLRMSRYIVDSQRPQVSRVNILNFATWELFRKYMSLVQHQTRPSIDIYSDHNREISSERS